MDRDVKALIDHVKKLVGQATPGPWFTWGEADWWSNGIDDMVTVATVDGEEERGTCIICNIGPPACNVYTSIAENKNQANAELIRQAPMLLSALVSRLEQAYEWKEE